MAHTPEPGKNQHELPQLVTPEQAGKMLALSRVRVFELMASGELKSMKIGRLRRIRVQAINEFIDRMESEA